MPFDLPLFAPQSGQQNRITTLAELKAALAAGGRWSIAAGTYTADEDLTLATDIILTPVGDVVIDLDGYTFNIDDADTPTTQIIGDVSGTYSIRFHDGATNIDIRNQASTLDLTLYNIISDTPRSGRALFCYSYVASGNLDVTLEGCTVHSVDTGDAISLHGDEGFLGAVTFTANNLTLYDVTAGTRGDAEGDGITAHKAYHTINITSSALTNCRKSGVNNVEGDCNITNTVFDACSVDGNSLIGFVAQRGTGTLTVDGCTFKGANYSAGAPEDGLYVSIGDTVTATIADTTFTDHGVGGMDYAIYIVHGTVTLTVENCLFVGEKAKAGDGHGIYRQASGVGTTTVNNCTFYDCNIGIYWMWGNDSVNRCIFHTCNYAIYYRDTEDLWADAEFDASLFYNITSNHYFYDREKGSSVYTVRSEDLTVDPLFVGNGDFRLQNLSPANRATDFLGAYGTVDAVATYTDPSGPVITIDAGDNDIVHLIFNTPTTSLVIQEINATLYITNNTTIYGLGGTGGSTTDNPTKSAGDGQDGQVALTVGSPATVYNNGTILGGGGGEGGFKVAEGVSSRGAGGGAANGQGSPGVNGGAAGADGTYDTGGDGGGDPGQPGADNDGSGGAAGAAFSGDVTVI